MRLVRTRFVYALPSLSDQTRAALIASMNPQPVDDDAEPIAQANQKVDVGETPNPPGKGAAQLDPAEVDDGQALADRGETAGMPIAGLQRCVAAQPASDDLRDVASLLFGGGRYPGDRLSVGAGDRHRIADREDFQVSGNG
jgi:hypothetical protein